MELLITADDFFLAAVAILKKNAVNVLPLNDELDQKFAELYSSVFNDNEKEAIPVFNIRVDEVHGNSRGFRETMYAARFNNIISLENPSFHRMTIKITGEDAEFLTENSDIAAKMRGHVLTVFANEITNANFISQP